MDVKMYAPKDMAGFSMGGMAVKIEKDGTCMIPESMVPEAMAHGFDVNPPKKAEEKPADKQP